LKHNNFHSLEKAKNYSFLLLKFRLRSEKEIYQRLKNRRFDEQVIRATISFLKNKEFLDDNLFAKSWIESRLKRPFGLRKIKNELNLKGIDKEIISEQISQIKDKYREEDIVSEIVKSKLAKLKDIEPVKAKRRIYAYLLRRGFSSDVVSEIIKNLTNES
jgi:regulatory protein